MPGVAISTARRESAIATRGAGAGVLVSRRGVGEELLLHLPMGQQHVARSVGQPPGL